MQLSKLDVVENHILAAVQMIAVEMNVVSTHLVVMATEDMLLDLAKRRGICLPLDHRFYIRSEYQNEWRKKIKEKYTFFKHADRDPDEKAELSEHDFRELNEIMTAVNIFSYGALSRQSNSCMQLYLAVIANLHTFILEPKMAADMARMRSLIGLENVPRDMAFAALRISLVREGLLPKTDDWVP